MATDLGKFITTQANKTGDTTAQLGRKGTSLYTLPSNHDNYLHIWASRIIEKTQDIVNPQVLTLGDPIYGMLGSVYWEEAPYNVLILDHTRFGILDTDILGDIPTSYILTNVYNDHNIFPEYFENDRFIGSDSTGSWFSNDYYYQLEDDEELITEYISKETNLIHTKAKYKINANYTTGSDASNDLDVYVIKYTGSDLINDYMTNFYNISDDGIKIKIINKTGDTININNFHITYE